MINVTAIFLKSISKTISFVSDITSTARFTTHISKTIIFPVLVAPVAPSSSFLLKEDGFYLLQENGNKIIL